MLAQLLERRRVLVRLLELLERRQVVRARPGERLPSRREPARGGAARARARALGDVNAARARAVSRARRARTGPPSRAPGRRDPRARPRGSSGQPWCTCAARWGARARAEPDDPPNDPRGARRGARATALAQGETYCVTCACAPRIMTSASATRAAPHSPMCAGCARRTPLTRILGSPRPTPNHSDNTSVFWGVRAVLDMIALFQTFQKRQDLPNPLTSPSRSIASRAQLAPR